MAGFDKSVFLQPKRDLFWKILLAVIAAALIGFGVALNTCVGLGNDSISVFVDGIHNLLQVDLGMAFNILNYTVLAIVLIFARHYVNVGTLIHVLMLGFFVNVGLSLYTSLSLTNSLIFRAAVAVVACLLLFFGIAMFIAVNIGVDSWTGLALMISDKIRCEYKFCRIAMDVLLLIVGFLLGGVVGVTTIVASLCGGPIIQAFVDFIRTSLLSKFNFKDN